MSIERRKPTSLTPTFSFVRVFSRHTGWTGQTVVGCRWSVAVLLPRSQRTNAHFPARALLCWAVWVMHAPCTTTHRTTHHHSANSKAVTVAVAHTNQPTNHQRHTPHHASTASYFYFMRFLCTVLFVIFSFPFHHSQNVTIFP